MGTPDHFFEESRTKKMVGGAGARVAFERVGVVFIENHSTEAGREQVLA